MGEGRTNHNFIVDSGGLRAFVRVGADLPFFGVSRAREQAAARAAHAAGVAPKVLHTEPPDILVVDFVPGRALAEADMHEAAASGADSPLLAQVTDVVRRLHACPVPEELLALQEEAGPSGWGGPHLAKWLRYAESEGYSRLPLLDGLRGLITQLEGAAGPTGPPMFCHFDLLADNFVLQQGGAVLLVDFEYTAPGQPLMDLAVLAMGCDLSPEGARNLLSSYLGREASEADVRQFRALLVLAAVRETFWGVTAELSGTSSLSPEEARDYADMNFRKFQTLRAEFEARAGTAATC